MTEKLFIGALNTNQNKKNKYLVRSVAQTRHIDKLVSVPLKRVKNKAFPIKNLAFKFFDKLVSVPLKGVKNKAFPIKNLAFKFFVSAPPKFAILPKFSKNHVLSSYVMSDLSYINSIQRYFHFLQCYKGFSEGTLNHNCLVYGKLKLQKSSFRGSSTIFINFSICKSNQ